MLSRQKNLASAIIVAGYFRNVIFPKSWVLEYLQSLLPYRYILYVYIQFISGYDLLNTENFEN
jgi:hypothetical protein